MSRRFRALGKIGLLSALGLSLPASPSSASPSASLAPVLAASEVQIAQVQAPDRELAQLSSTIRRGHQVLSEPTLHAAVGEPTVIRQTFHTAGGEHQVQLEVELHPLRSASKRVYRGEFRYSLNGVRGRRFTTRLPKGVTRSFAHEVGDLEWTMTVHVHDALP